MTGVPAFDVLGPLPTGTMILEASAGTGKTFTIAALAARYVAEGTLTLPELMLVTFGRRATTELRDRVRDRLVSAERGLADPGRARTSDDRVLAHIADVDPDELERRRDRLGRAVANFDAATIATTHQFCLRMLIELGMAADSEPDAVFVDDIDDLITEVVDDLYIRKYAVAGAAKPEFTRDQALEIAHNAVGNFQARLEPSDAAPDSEAGVRYSFAKAVRYEVDGRKRTLRLYGYDDMLTGLETALTDPVRGPVACQRLRDRFRVVLVDEFQDTDPVQWSILRTAFHGHSTLVLIGDPKQAIYAFRGADVVTYLAAAGTATAHATLGVNWRSDEPLLTAMSTVLGSAALGDPRIVVRPVSAAHMGRRLTVTPCEARLRIRVIGRDGFRLRKGLASAPEVRRAVAADVAADIVTLLDSGARMSDRPLAPRDIAVLVRTNRQSAQVHDALTRSGVPAVLAGTSSVFNTSAARDWLAVLQALEQPHRANRVAAAALTDIVGWTAEALASATENELEALRTRLRRWVAVLADRGVAALSEAITTAGLLDRLLRQDTGERTVTDIRHVASAMHAAAVEEQFGVTTIVQWLRHRIDDAPQDESAERSRRLESDAAAIQILTVHGSKGLQFPVVYVPYGWDRYVKDPELLSLHDEDGARVLDVGGSSGPGFSARRDRHLEEDAGEDLRLLYVALTRAQCQLVTWWAPTTNTRASALHRLLFGRPAPGVTPADQYPVLDDQTALDRLGELATSDLAIEPVRPAPATRWIAPATPATTLDAAHFGRRLDTDWHRTSYSRLTIAAHDGVGVSSEPEDSHLDDEPVPTHLSDVDSDFAVGDLPSPMADLPTGATFGTIVHSVLETTDTGAPDLLAELTTRAREQVYRTTSRLDADALAVALLPALRTPLGPLATGRSLADIGSPDRLPELDFEYPLVGGDSPAIGPATTLAAVGQLVGRHLPPDDPLAAYPDQFDTELGRQRLRGYLAGSIDAVVRVPGPHGHRYLVIDYKTNWLGPIGPTGPQPLTTRHYRPDALARAMMGAHYPLQALLYAVAVHRFLRWRQPGYDPHRHLGGVLYLFLRGMCGPDTPTVDGVPCGVFSWQPPVDLVIELSHLLHGATR